MTARRNPDKTREDLLQAGFEEIHRNGFRAADVSRILADAGLTKGALYHHFGSKKGLGYAVVEEVVRGMIVERWLGPLQRSDDPITTLAEILDGAVAEGEEHVRFGCPLNNLAQEMAPVDEGFRTRIERISRLWRTGLGEALAWGQEKGTVRGDLEAQETATFLVAALEGCIGQAKSAQSADILAVCARGVIGYLETLRPSRDVASVPPSPAEIEATH